MIDQHLDANDVAAYIDGVASGERRVRMESHLAHCTECREEVVEAIRLVDTMRVGRSWRRGALGVAVAAGLLLVLVLPRGMRTPTGTAHRKAAVTTTATPTALAPTGTVDSLVAFIWTSVPHAEAYELLVFDSTGTVVLRVETSDTLVHAPLTGVLGAGQPYFWRVQANVGYGRHATSELVDFSIARTERR